MVSASNFVRLQKKVHVLIYPYPISKTDKKKHICKYYRTVIFIVKKISKKHEKAIISSTQL
ncbi:hypothetical protein ACTXT7_007921 [Hymenolepis weldensis]